MLETLIIFWRRILIAFLLLFNLEFCSKKHEKELPALFTLKGDNITLIQNAAGSNDWLTDDDSRTQRK
jgi:hypothetical protein